MKVSYIKCDICGEEIPKDKARYEINQIIPAFNMKTPLDICFKCIERMQALINSERKKEGSNGPSA